MHGLGHRRDIFADSAVVDFNVMLCLHAAHHAGKEAVHEVFHVLVDTESENRTEDIADTETDLAHICGHNKTCVARVVHQIELVLQKHSIRTHGERSAAADFAAETDVGAGFCALIEASGHFFAKQALAAAIVLRRGDQIKTMGPRIHTRTDEVEQAAMRRDKACLDHRRVPFLIVAVLGRCIFVAGHVFKLLVLLQVAEKFKEARKKAGGPGGNQI